METNILKQGDIVKLKSGGPVMTLSKIEQGNTVICQWFDNDNKLHTDRFRLESLEKQN